MKNKLFKNEALENRQLLACGDYARGSTAFDATAATKIVCDVVTTSGTLTSVVGDKLTLAVSSSSATLTSASGGVNFGLDVNLAITLVTSADAAKGSGTCALKDTGVIAFPTLANTFMVTGAGSAAATKTFTESYDTVSLPSIPNAQWTLTGANAIGVTTAGSLAAISVEPDVLLAWMQCSDGTAAVEFVTGNPAFTANAAMPASTALTLTLYSDAAATTTYNPTGAAITIKGGVTGWAEMTGGTGFGTAFNNTDNAVLSFLGTSEQKAFADARVACALGLGPCYII